MIDQVHRQRLWLFAAVIVMAIAIALITNALRADNNTSQPPAPPPTDTPHPQPTDIPASAATIPATSAAAPVTSERVTSTVDPALTAVPTTVGQNPTVPSRTNVGQEPIGTTMVDGKTNYIYLAATADGSSTQPSNMATPAESAAEAVAAQWLTAVCNWSYTAPWNSNLAAAGRYAISDQPLVAPAWQIAKADWPTIKANKIASSCSDVAAHVDRGNQSAQAPLTVAVIITATQTMTQDRVTSQSQPVEEVRLLALTADGWRVGPPTAAA